MIPPRFEGAARVIVLGHDLDKDMTNTLIREKKTKLFSSMMRRPDRKDVNAEPAVLFYEAVLHVSARYAADYFRKSTHSITVDQSVYEVVLGDYTFPAKQVSSVKKAFAGRRAKRKVNLDLEEHVSVEFEDSAHFDRSGRMIKFPYKTDSKSVERYPKRTLRNHAANLRRPEIDAEEALMRLAENMKDRIEPDVRDLNEEFSVLEVTEIYVPIFEVRLNGPNNSTRLMRIDAARRKVL